jgi:twitching motility two-component system response regulator PilH
MDPSGRPVDDQQSALLVDDHSSNFALHRERLNALGYHVIRADNPAAALAIAKQSMPRIIFVSKGRQGADVAPFLQALRSNDTTRHIPVGILSGDHDRRLERFGLKGIGRETW